jgi:hypothetical protein
MADELKAETDQTQASSQPDVGIFVCCHGDAKLPDDFSGRPYVLVGGGGYRSDTVKLSDDAGDSVSRYNRYINEMSVMYWVAENYERLPDFIGFAHYRRRLDLSSYGYGASEVACPCEEVGGSIRQQLTKHFPCRGRILDLFISRLVDSSPDMGDLLDRYFNAERELHRCSMFVMPRALFTEYWALMKRCIAVAVSLVDFADIEHCGDVRALSHILERMTSFWIWNARNSGAITISPAKVRHTGHRRIATAPVPVSLGSSGGT